MSLENNETNKCSFVESKLDEVVLTGGDIKTRVLLLLEWRSYFATATAAHTRAFNEVRELDEKITIANALAVVAVVGFGANKFLSSHLNEIQTFVFDIIFVFIGALSAFLFILDLYLALKEKAQIHKQCASHSRNLVRKISRYLCFDNIPNHIIHSLNKEAHYIETSTPIITSKKWDEAKKIIAEKRSNLKTEIEFIRMLNERHKMDLVP